MLNFISKHDEASVDLPLPHSPPSLFLFLILLNRFKAVESHNKSTYTKNHKMQLILQSYSLSFLFFSLLLNKSIYSNNNAIH